MDVQIKLFTPFTGRCVDDHPSGFPFGMKAYELHWWGQMDGEEGEGGRGAMANFPQAC